MDKILRVNMTDLAVREEPCPQEWLLLGGRALSAKILLSEVDPKCDPLGPENKVIFAPGALSGTAAPTSGRMSVGGKSPLTDGIKEANSGGQAGQKLIRLGYRALIVEGQAKDPGKRYLIFIHKDGVEIRECPELKGLRTYAASEKLSTQFSKRAAFALCGPAGELGFQGASVAFTDEGKRHPTRHAARGGLGAAMGAKGLKAVVVDDEGTRPRVAKDAAFKALAVEFTKTFQAGPNYMEFGTSTNVPMANMMFSLPTHNRHQMQFEGADSLNGMHIIENYPTRGGAQHGCMTGCIVQCSNTVNDAEGKYVTSALEFETVALCGSNCEIADLDQVARIDRICDDLGLDTIETGGALGLAMDCGALPFGDAAGAIALLEKVDQGDALAETIARGVMAVARRFNVTDRVPAIRRQGLPAWEPRSVLGTGVTYATSAMGADHTAGHVIMPAEDPVQASQENQLLAAIVDSVGLCMFQLATIEQIRPLYNAMYGTQLSFDDMLDMGWQCMQDEWEFNRRAGYGPEDCDVPEWLRTEQVPGSGTVFSITKEQLMRVFERMPVSDFMRKTSIFA